MTAAYLFSVVLLLVVILLTSPLSHAAVVVPTSASGLKVFTTYTTNLHWLFVNMVDSLVLQGVDPSMIFPRVLPATRGKYAHGSPEFLEFCINRTDWIYQTVKAHPGEVLLFADVDVQVFPGWWDRTKKMSIYTYTKNAVEDGRDIIFQPEYNRKRGNAGFYLTLGTPNSARFFAVVRDRLTDVLKAGKLMHDQDMYYLVQRDRRFRVTVFPWILNNAGLGAKFAEPVLVHHAHMSGRFKFYNMAKLLLRKADKLREGKLHSGACLKEFETERPPCCLYSAAYVQSLASGNHVPCTNSTIVRQ
eukprot:PhM_4_TR18763/c0_g1_i3/m.4295